MHEGSRRAIIAALFANAGISIAKFFGFAITGSSAMLAEGIHSVADTSNQGLLLLGGSRAGRPADADHQFGHGRERYFWSFVVALVLFSLGGLFALYEGVEKLRHPHEVTSPQWAIGILLVAIVLETFSLRTAIREANHVREGRSWVAFIRRSKNPELPVVLLEDIGAMVGLFLALGGVSMTLVADEPRWDAVGTLAIGVLLVAIAIILAAEMKSLLIGESAGSQELAVIRATLAATPNVNRVIHMRTQHMGPEELLVAAKLEFAADLTIEELASAVDLAEGRLREALPIARMIYLEPDLYRADRPAPGG